MTYAEKLKDPRWQKRRLEIMKRDEFYCVRCDDNTATLHVHHRWYEGEPWDAPDEALETLCESCHKEESEAWKHETASLLRELAKFGCRSPDIVELMCAFHYAVKTDQIEIVIGAVETVLTDPGIQQYVIHDRRAKRLARQRAHEEEAKGSTR